MSSTSNENPGSPEATDEELNEARSAQEAPQEGLASLGITVDGEDPTTKAEFEYEANPSEELAGGGDGDGGSEEQDYSDPEEAIQALLDERTEDLKRVNAEFANYRRRVERDRQAVILSAKADLAEKLLPLIDDMDLAAKHGDLHGPLKAAYDKLVGVLNGMKVEAFGDEGEAFNPELHEAVQDSSTTEDKVLGSVLRKGYRIEQRVLRTAMVIIADAEA